MASNEPKVEFTLNEVLDMAAEYERHENVQLALKVQDGLKKLKFITEALELRKSSIQQQQHAAQQPEQPQQDDFGEPIQRQPQRQHTPIPPTPKPTVRVAPRPVPRPVPPVIPPAMRQEENEGFMEAHDVMDSDEQE